MKDDEEDNDLHFDDFEIDPYERRTRLFVNYLPQELTDEEFNTLFIKVTLSLLKLTLIPVSAAMILTAPVAKLDT